MILLFISIFLGWLSLQSSIENGKNLFFEEHRLPSQVWQDSLHHYHLEIQKNIELNSIILKSHPDPYSESSHIWANQNGCWVYISHSPYQKDQGPELWTCSTTQQPSLSWVKLGTGIKGFEQTLDFLAQHQHKSVEKRNWIDPKEIRY